MTNAYAGLILAALLAVAAPARAHHSETVFDHSKQEVAQGTVKEFIYANPHASLIVVETRNGVAREMRLETDSPSGLMRNGVKRDSLLPGDKVTVTYHPKHGDPAGGGIVRIVKSDGTTYVLEMPK